MWAKRCFNSLSKKQESSSMLKCVGSCPEGDGQSLEEEPCFSPGTRGVAAVQPWSKPLLQVLFLVQMMLLVEKKWNMLSLYHYCSRHTCCFFQCDPIKKNQVLLFVSCCLNKFSWWAAPMGTSKHLCPLRYQGGQTGRGEICSDPHNMKYSYFAKLKME